LLYEANPLALIAEQAGGLATSGEESILNIIPKGIHQRTPLVIGGRSEVEEFSAGSQPFSCLRAGWLIAFLISGK
jgi:fructose-1,6-bisphosphatase I